MQEHLPTWLNVLLGWLALPKVGLSAIFVTSFVSATLLPLGSEAALLGVVHVDRTLLWPAIGVATLGNTLGGMFTWFMGRGAAEAWAHYTHRASDMRALRWLQRFGPKACLLAWLPVVGDPLCAMAGWLRMNLWRCTLYMAIGKFARYVVLTVGTYAVMDGYWR